MGCKHCGRSGSGRRGGVRTASACRPCRPAHCTPVAADPAAHLGRGVQQREGADLGEAVVDDHGARHVADLQRAVDGSRGVVSWGAAGRREEDWPRSPRAVNHRGHLEHGRRAQDAAVLLQAQPPNLITQTPGAHLLQVARGAGGDLGIAKDDLLSGAAAQGAHDARKDLLLADQAGVLACRDRGITGKDGSAGGGRARAHREAAGRNPQ